MSSAIPNASAVSKSRTSSAPMNEKAMRPRKAPINSASPTVAHERPPAAALG